LSALPPQPLSTRTRNHSLFRLVTTLHPFPDRFVLITGAQHLGLAECRPQSRVLDTQLVNERTTLLPSSVRLISRGECGIE